jgi:hypothetical protein
LGSGEPVLDAWLRQRALKNQGSGASRTYVFCAGSGREVVGYYRLATGALSFTQAPGKVRRNRPDPVPVMVIGRLAVPAEWPSPCVRVVVAWIGIEPWGR